MAPKWFVILLFWAHHVCAQQDAGGCTCVPFYLCNNGTVNTNGESIIDIRIKPEECTSYMDTCCNKEEVLNNTSLRHPTVTAKLPCGKRQPDGTGYRIIGDDNNEAQFGEFPWMVAVFLKKRNEATYIFKCGGSLIHPQVVLTAAHCVSDSDNNQIKIRVGEWDTQTRKEIYPHEERNIESVTRHREFNSRNLQNDVALLFFKDPINLTHHIKAACLPPRDFVASGAGCFVSGWGKENFGATGKYQVILKKIELPVMNRPSCQNAFRGTRLGRHFNLHESFMCAGGEEGKDACTGDGGGPLVCPIEDEEDRYYQVGIVAWGIGCGENGVPGAYVDVAHFKSWIDRQIKKKNLEKDSYEYT